MSNVHDEIKLLAMDLADGERSSHLVCPICNGGSSHERSLLIWVNSGVITYKCYRVKCGVHGVIGDSGVRVPAVSKPRKESYSSLLPVPLPPRVTSYLKHRFTFTRDELLINGVKWEATQQRILIPITGIRHTLTEHEGWLARAYSVLQTGASSIPKAVAHFKVEQPTCLMKPYGVAGDSLILCEDFWSAMRVNRYLPACALSGTHLGEQAIKAMLRAGVKRLTFVLDADARQKARQLKHDYALLFDTRTVLLSGVDAKDMTEEQMSELIEELNHV